jgi:hypothetical protein
MVGDDTEKHMLNAISKIDGLVFAAAENGFHEEANIGIIFLLIEYGELYSCIHISYPPLLFSLSRYSYFFCKYTIITLCVFVACFDSSKESW